MKINSYNLNDNLNPQIVVNVSGTLMYFNEDARKVFRLKIKSDISDIINIDIIKKFSMYSNKTEIVETYHPYYRYAVMSISGDGINKIVLLTFKLSIGKTEEILKVEKNILMIANKITLNKKVISTSLDVLSNEIKQLIAAKGHFLNTYVKILEPVNVNVSHLQALILCGISMMNETSPKRPVDLYIRRNLRNHIEIKIIVRVDSNEERYTAQGVEEVFPWTSIRIAAIDEICQNNDIDYNVTLTERSLKVVYTIKEGAILSTKVNSFDDNVITIEDLYEFLSPRDNINLSYTD